MSHKKRILSGIQPSGNLTIGNYLGALKQWVAKQEEYECYFCIVDLHAITVPQDARQLHQTTREVAAIYLAAGLDPAKAAMFIQSHVTAHAELGWLLTCYAPLGWLYRMTQFKDKSTKQQQESISTGLLSYPILMAADILLYQAHAVPVGDDQRQHIEFTRDLAQRFNSLYGETFILPEFMPPVAGARIMGLDNPTAKMSKSETSELHAIFLLDTPDVIRKKCMRAVTDSGRDILFSDDPEKAGVNNLLTIYQAFTNKSQAEVVADFATARGYGDLKKGVAEVVIDGLRPLQETYTRLTNEQGYLDRILAEGAAKAQEVAHKTLQDVKEKIGLVLPQA